MVATFKIKKKGVQPRVAKMLGKLRDYIVEGSANYVKQSGRDDHPLRYNELTAASTISVALARISPLHMGESYITRRKNPGDGESGRVDFWCRDMKKDNLDWLWETKHGVFYWNNKASLRTGLVNKWESGCEQAANIKVGELDWSEKSCRITYMIVYFYGYWQTCTDHIRSTKTPWNKSYLAVKDALSKKQKVHWSALWDVSSCACLSPLEIGTKEGEEPEHWSVGFFSHIHDSV